MAVEITMPQLSDTMSEGKILTWLKQVGDKVSRGDALAEVETDKADLEVESFHEGVLLKVTAEKGQSVAVGTVIAVIGQPGESLESEEKVSTSSGNTQQQDGHEPAKIASKNSHNFSDNTLPAQEESSAHRVKISPLARNYAHSVDVDYSHIQGTGDGGRIVKRDIDKVVDGNRQSSPSPVSEAIASVETRPQPIEAPNVEVGSAQAGLIPLTKMRQTIAARMVESVTHVPHFFATARVDVTKLMEMRQTLKTMKLYEGLTVNHLVIRACAMALKVVPRINCAYSQQGIVNPASINIGIVTAVNDGLLIPVLSNAGDLPLAEVVSEARSLVQRSRAGRPKPTDLVGATFGISNMGLFDVESFTAIINPGTGAILAVGPAQKEPVVNDGALSVGTVMRLTLSVDHRIIDGVVSGEFLTELKRLLEEPVLLIA